MSFDAKTVAAVVDQANTLLDRGRIRKVIRPSASLFLVQIDASSGKWGVLICTDPARLTFCIAPWGHREIQAMALWPAEDPLTLQFRKYLKDGKIRGFFQHGQDRICGFQAEKIDDGGNQYRTTVVAELTGRSSNLILVDDSGMQVLGAAQYHPPTGPQARPVLPGETYSFPRDDGFRMKEDTQEDPQPPLENTAIFDAWIFRELSRSVDQLRGRIARNLKKVRGRCQGKISRMEEEARESDLSAGLRRQADSMMACLYSIPQGAGRLTIPDCYGGQDITLDLDPSRSAVDNANRIYARARKLDSRLKKLQPLIDEEKALLETLDTMIYDLDQQEDLQGLAEVASALLEVFDRKGRGVLVPAELAFLRKVARDGEKSSPFSIGKSSGSSRGGKARSKGGSIRCRVRLVRMEELPDLEILVGTSSIQNHNLVFRVAGRDDLWFHAREIPGSHVIIRRDNGVAIGPEDSDYEEILDIGSRLAAFYSKARQDKSVTVQYTYRKYLKKPGTNVPGLVIVTRENTLAGRPELPIGARQELVDR